MYPEDLSWIKYSGEFIGGANIVREYLENNSGDDINMIGGAININGVKSKMSNILKRYKSGDKKGAIQEFSTVNTIMKSNDVDTEKIKSEPSYIIDILYDNKNSKKQNRLIPILFQYKLLDRLLKNNSIKFKQEEVNKLSKIDPLISEIAQELNIDISNLDIYITDAKINTLLYNDIDNNKIILKPDMSKFDKSINILTIKNITNYIDDTNISNLVKFGNNMILDKGNLDYIYILNIYNMAFIQFKRVFDNVPSINMTNTDINQINMIKFLLPQPNKCRIKYNKEYTQNGRVLSEITCQNIFKLAIQYIILYIYSNANSNIWTGFNSNIINSYEQYKEADKSKMDILQVTAYELLGYIIYKWYAPEFDKLSYDLYDGFLLDDVDKKITEDNIIIDYDYITMDKLLTMIDRYKTNDSKRNIYINLYLVLVRLLYNDRKPGYMKYILPRINDLFTDIDMKNAFEMNNSIEKLYNNYKSSEGNAELESIYSILLNIALIRKIDGEDNKSDYLNFDVNVIDNISSNIKTVVGGSPQKSYNNLPNAEPMSNEDMHKLLNKNNPSANTSITSSSSEKPANDSNLSLRDPPLPPNIPTSPSENSANIPISPSKKPAINITATSPSEKPANIPISPSEKPANDSNLPLRDPPLPPNIPTSSSEKPANNITATSSSEKPANIPISPSEKPANNITATSSSENSANIPISPSEKPANNIIATSPSEKPANIPISPSEKTTSELSATNISNTEQLDTYKKLRKNLDELEDAANSNNGQVEDNSIEKIQTNTRKMAQMNTTYPSGFSNILDKKTYKSDTANKWSERIKKIYRVKEESPEQTFIKLSKIANKYRMFDKIRFVDKINDADIKYLELIISMNDKLVTINQYIAYILLADLQISSRFNSDTDTLIDIINELFYYYLQYKKIDEIDADKFHIFDYVYNKVLSQYIDRFMYRFPDNMSELIDRVGITAGNIGYIPLVYDAFIKLYIENLLDYVNSSMDSNVEKADNKLNKLEYIQRVIPIFAGITDIIKRLKGYVNTDNTGKNDEYIANYMELYDKLIPIIHNKKTGEILNKLRFVKKDDNSKYSIIDKNPLLSIISNITIKKYDLYYIAFVFELYNHENPDDKKTIDIIKTRLSGYYKDANLIINTLFKSGEYKTKIEYIINIGVNSAYGSIENAIIYIANLLLYINDANYSADIVDDLNKIIVELKNIPIIFVDMISVLKLNNEDERIKKLYDMISSKTAANIPINKSLYPIIKETENNLGTKTIEPTQNNLSKLNPTPQKKSHDSIIPNTVSKSYNINIPHIQSNTTPNNNKIQPIIPEKVSTRSTVSEAADNIARLESDDSGPIRNIINEKFRKLLENGKITIHDLDELHSDIDDMKSKDPNTNNAKIYDEALASCDSIETYLKYLKISDVKQTINDTKRVKGIDIMRYFAKSLANKVQGVLEKSPADTNEESGYFDNRAYIDPTGYDSNNDNNTKSTMSKNTDNNVHITGQYARSDDSILQRIRNAVKTPAGLSQFLSRKGKIADNERETLAVKEDSEEQTIDKLYNIADKYAIVSITDKIPPISLEDINYIDMIMMDTDKNNTPEYLVAYLIKSAINYRDDLNSNQLSTEFIELYKEYITYINISDNSQKYRNIFYTAYINILSKYFISFADKYPDSVEELLKTSGIDSNEVDNIYQIYEKLINIYIDAILRYVKDKDMNSFMKYDYLVYYIPQVSGIFNLVVNIMKYNVNRDIEQYKINIKQLYSHISEVSNNKKIQSLLKLMTYMVKNFNPIYDTMSMIVEKSKDIYYIAYNYELCYKNSGYSYDSKLANIIISQLNLSDKFVLFSNSSIDDKIKYAITNDNNSKFRVLYIILLLTLSNHDKEYLSNIADKLAKIIMGMEKIPSGLMDQIKQISWDIEDKRVKNMIYAISGDEFENKEDPKEIEAALEKNPNKLGNIIVFSRLKEALIRGDKPYINRKISEVMKSRRKFKLLNKSLNKRATINPIDDNTQSVITELGNLSTIDDIDAAIIPEIEIVLKNSHRSADYTDKILLRFKEAIGKKDTRAVVKILDDVNKQDIGLFQSLKQKIFHRIDKSNYSHLTRVNPSDDNDSNELIEHIDEESIPILKSADLNQIKAFRDSLVNKRDKDSNPANKKIYNEYITKYDEYISVFDKDDIHKPSISSSPNTTINSIINNTDIILNRGTSENTTGLNSSQSQYDPDILNPIITKLKNVLESTSKMNDILEPINDIARRLFMPIFTLKDPRLTNIEYFIKIQLNNTDIKRDIPAILKSIQSQLHIALGYFRENNYRVKIYKLYIRVIILYIDILLYILLHDSNIDKDRIAMYPELVSEYNDLTTNIKDKYKNKLIPIANYLTKCREIIKYMDWRDIDTSGEINIPNTADVPVSEIRENPELPAKEVQPIIETSQIAINEPTKENTEISASKKGFFDKFYNKNDNKTVCDDSVIFKKLKDEYDAAIIYNFDTTPETDNDCDKFVEAWGKVYAVNKKIVGIIEQIKEEKLCNDIKDELISMNTTLEDKLKYIESRLTNYTPELRDNISKKWDIAKKKIDDDGEFTINSISGLAGAFMMAVLALL